MGQDNNAPEITAPVVVAPEPIPAALANSPDYEILREISRGGMGVVYLARNRRMDRLEGLKVINAGLLKRSGALERFEREMRAAARLSHPNIVIAYSSPPLEGLLAFAMEYVDGIDLHQLVKSRGPLPVSNACYYVNQAAKGLQHAFEREMVHRDIKPNNLMLMIDGKKQVIKILDFGLAKATSENPLDAGLTREGQMLGTPHYMAPEQSIDAAKADIRADIYSLGCTLYSLLTGDPPFKAKESLYEILHAHQRLAVPPLNELRSDVPAELVAIAAKMMAKEPAQRYQQPVEVAQALAPYFKQGVKPIPTGTNRFTTPPPAQSQRDTANSKAADATRQPTPPPAPSGPAPVGGGGPDLVQANMVPAGTSDGTNPMQTMLELVVDTGSHPTAGRPAFGRRRPAQRRSMSPKIWIGVASAFVLLGGLGLWASGVFSTKGKTRHGDLVAAADEPDTNDDEADFKTAPDADPPAQSTNNEDLPQDQGTKKLEVADDGKDFPDLPDDAGPRDVEAPRKFTTTPSGLSYRILRHSDGPKPAAADHVLADYKGWLDGGTQFDNSYERGEPTELDLNMVIAGWKEGLQLVAVGGMIELEVPPSLGYGAQRRPAIPANSTLHFIIELREINLRAPAVPAVGVSPAVEKDDGFVPLFNGKDLSGWKTHPSQPGKWRVENGLLVGSGPAISHLYSIREDFSDVHLRVEASCNDGGNSGVAFRASFGPEWPAIKPAYPMGYEANIFSSKAKGNWTGGLVVVDRNDADSGKYVLNFQKPPVPPDEWFTLEALANDNHIIIKVNGRVTADYIDQQKRFTRGRLALQQYDPQTVIRFRKIEIREGSSATVDSTEPATDEPRPAPVSSRAGRAAQELEKARAAYDAEVKRAGEAVRESLTKREEAARKAGNKKLLDQVQAERKAFEAGSEPPRLIPASLKRKLVATRTALENAYLAAVKEYTKAGLDQDAARTDREFERFLEAPDPTSNWVQLFNGKALTGWKRHPEDKSSWSVENGVLVGTGGQGYLYSERGNYTNFRLRVEVLISDKGNSGVFLRSPFSKGIPDGYEPNIDATGGSTGSLIVYSQQKIVYVEKAALQIARPNEWFTMDILVKGEAINVAIDGKQVVRFRDPQKTFNTGHVVLQVMAGTVKFRKVEVSELNTRP